MRCCAEQVSLLQTLDWRRLMSTSMVSYFIQFIFFVHYFKFFDIKENLFKKNAGYTIPKGWKILVWNRGVHMDPETYENPKEFDPSRWEVCI